MDINAEVKSQNSFLDGMSGDMFKADGLFGSTLKKMDMMVKSGGGNHMYILIAFVVFVFLAIYFLIAR